MPVGKLSPSITTRWMAALSMAMFIASRTLTSAKGFLPFTSEEASSSAPRFMPRKMERICDTVSTFRPDAALIRSRS